MNPISNYLARLEMALCPMTPLEHTPPSDDKTASPAKRPRSDSPEEHSSPSPLSSSSSHSSYTSSVPPSPLFCGVTLSSSPTSLHPISEPPLRSILSPSSSPPGSRPLSRKSSTGCSSKSVRFARCTNASVFPAFSSNEYDRTPITPTCESESLNLPARCPLADGWVKCVQRTRKADKERKAIAAAKGQPSPTSIEGVHGLVGGGYFVGDERDAMVSSDDSEEVEDVSGDDGMVVDDEEEGESEHDNVPQLTSDDSSSSEESDAVASVSGDVVNPIVAPASIVEAKSTTDLNEPTETTHVPSEEEEKKQKCRERYGMCALGKYTRAEVFQSFDSLGGF